MLQRQELAGLDTEATARELLPKVRADIERVAAGGRPLDGITADGKRLLRYDLARQIQVVFVRPAESRSNKLPIGDRVKIVWADEAKLELPRRGERFEPRALAW